MAGEAKQVSSFSSKIGLIMATAGSAVGLGNIWKFPYIAGENGGGAFLIIYLICVAVFGIPMLMTEFVIGKQSGKSAYGAFRAIRNNNRWQWLSWCCMLTALIIMGFYFVVTGWCFHYVTAAIGHSFKGLDTTSFTAHFNELVHNGSGMFYYSLLAIVITAAVLWFDVNKGIERLSKILMPLLLMMMILMAGRVLMLPDSNIGMSFFFEADFSKITPQVVLAAMGQCFFSLSIGMGAIITYGAYMPKRQNIITTSLQVSVIDTLVAVLAGLIIFPAVFAFGVDPAEGPQLVFVVLPAVFEQMSFSWLSSILFFGLLCVAAVTSTISLMEVVVAFMTDATAETKHPLNRHKAVLIVSAVVLLFVVANVLSMSDVRQWLSLAGKNFFDWSDMLTANIFMPLNALAMIVFAGWFMKKADIHAEIGRKNKWQQRFSKVYVLLIRYFIPIAILAIFLNGIGVI